MRTPLLATLALFSTPVLAAAQVTSWTLAKGPVYQQSADNTDPGAPITWLVLLDVDMTDVGDASSVVISGGGIVGSKAAGQDQEFWTFEEEFASQAMMNATFPSGATYTITLSGGALGTVAQTATFGTEQYPVAPYLTGSDWSDLLTMNPTKPFTLHWNDPGTSLLPSGAIFLFAEEVISGNDPLDLQLAPSATSALIPAGTLSTGLLHDANIFFGNTVAISGAGGFGAFGVVGHFSADVFSIATLLGASVAHRNSGSNPNSYVANPVAIGKTWTATVDVQSTGHTHGTVIAMVAPAFLPLPGGQTLLIVGPKVFQLPLVPGPIANWSVPIPDDVSLVGITVYSQAAHLFGATPFLLSNAQDLTVGV